MVNSFFFFQMFVDISILAFIKYSHMSSSLDFTAAGIGSSFAAVARAGR